MESTLTMEFTNYFKRIYIINLPERKDRRDEMAEQLAQIGLSLNHPNIQLFPAIRPKDAGDFPTIGAHGCFLSHLSILKDAEANQLNSILILEDDLNFSANFNEKISQALSEVGKQDWSVFYGGHRLPEQSTNALNVIEIPADTGVITAHFIAFHGDIIAHLIAELELILSRKAGDPLGGPMHVDGAYSWFRQRHAKYRTFACFPALGYQRASRTDIHQTRWFDQVFIVKNIVSTLRKLKNKLH